jgi:hypothetical protein
MREWTQLRRAFALPFLGLAWAFGIVSVAMMAAGVMIAGHDDGPFDLN